MTRKLRATPNGKDIKMRTDYQVLKILHLLETKGQTHNSLIKTLLIANGFMQKNGKPTKLLLDLTKKRKNLLSNKVKIAKMQKIVQGDI